MPDTLPDRCNSAAQPQGSHRMLQIKQIEYSRAAQAPTHKTHQSPYGHESQTASACAVRGDAIQRQPPCSNRGRGRAPLFIHGLAHQDVLADRLVQDPRALRRKRDAPANSDRPLRARDMANERGEQARLATANGTHDLHSQGLCSKGDREPKRNSKGDESLTAIRRQGCASVSSVCCYCR